MSTVSQKTETTVTTPEEAAQAWAEIVGDQGGAMNDTLYLRHLAYFIAARDAEVRADERAKVGGQS